MNTDKKIRVTFHGGTGWVTGANFLLENVSTTGGKPTKILIDCGMYQGGEDASDKNYEDFTYDPSEIDYLIITHSHADHIGRVPKLVKDGFRGKIYSTEASYDLAEVMLADSLKIIGYEAKKKEIDPMYEKEDVEQAFKLWRQIPLHNPLEIPGGFTMTLHDAGHILGSAMAKFNYGTKNILFTGDIGNSPDPLLRDTEIINDADYMIIESVYGDRNHEDREERVAKLKSAIMETIVKKGILMIPTFALERTQNILYILNDLVETGELPSIPVFLDSPLAINITNVFRKHTHLLNDDVQQTLKDDDDVFMFPGLKETYTIDDSKAIMRHSNPKVIVSSAGMSHAGRIVHHEKQYLGNADNMLLFVGYQAVGTLGRIIQDGAKHIKLLGREINIKADVRTISGYSAHKDSDHLLEFVSHSSERLRHVFVCMGETKSSLFLVQRIRDYLGVTATAPDTEDSVILDMS
ncbi:MAG: metallo-beta-lactamase family protein [Crocinitomicaceae bacterium]|jgi:metallo-beta-lactamase family protein